MMGQIVDAVPKNILITGGAGFIGSHLVETFLNEGKNITILDNMSNSNEKWLKKISAHENLKVIQGDIKNSDDVKKAMKLQQQVWHLAGNANIPLGYEDTKIDLDSAVCGTRNILQAMVDEGVQEIIFTSSGSVYGNLAFNMVPETSGPLQPLSMYGAGKVSAEAFISAYCNLFNIKSWIFRFGNVLGGRMSRGVIKDFIKKLKQNPNKLTILGDGKQSKSYFLVEDCIEGMRYVLNHYTFTNKNKVDVFNLGNQINTSVVGIADIIAEVMNLKEVEYEFTREEAWPGDQPVVNLDVSKVEDIGWAPKTSSDGAVREAALRMVEYTKEP